MAAKSLIPHRGPLGAPERGAVAGFLAGYSGDTRVSYTTDLRLFAVWCADNRLLHRTARPCATALSRHAPRKRVVAVRCSRLAPKSCV
jgi:hypothetical protein